MRSFLVLLATVIWSSASAQATSSSYRLVGTVSTSDGRPLGGAEISIVQRDTSVRATRSDSVGRFAFEGLSTLDLTLRARHLGYEPQLLSVHMMKAGRTANISVTLEPSVATLAPVLVEDSAKHARVNPRMIAFNERRATNSLGHYITEEMLTELKPRYASEALRAVSGVTLRPATIGNLVRLRGCNGRGSKGPLVWLDAVRLPGAEIDDVTQGADVAGIEVYNSLAGVPAQFFDRSATCGTILVWTKHR